MPPRCFTSRHYHLKFVRWLHVHLCIILLSFLRCICLQIQMLFLALKFCRWLFEVFCSSCKAVPVWEHVGCFDSCFPPLFCEHCFRTSLWSRIRRGCVCQRMEEKMGFFLTHRKIPFSEPLTDTAPPLFVVCGYCLLLTGLPIAERGLIPDRAVHRWCQVSFLLSILFL